MNPEARQFSFIGHPARILLQFALDIVHGIEKIDLICYNPATASLEGETGEIVSFNNTIQPLGVDLGARIGAINKERDKEPDFEWFENKLLPYQISEKNGKARNLFNETEMIVLLVRIPNRYDGKKDLLFMFFDKEMKSFGLSKGDKELSAALKSIIEKSYVKLLLKQVADVYNNLEILSGISQMVANTGKHIELLNGELRESQQRNEEILEISAEQILEKYRQFYQRNYFFTEGAKDYIQKYSGSFRDFENIIINAVEMVNNMMVINPKSAIPINETYLFTSDSQEMMADQATPPEMVNQSAAVKFLDKLENAAISVKMRKLPLTSENVAQAHPVPIKPPAISYGMKYHKDKIRFLLNNYPAKWANIRNDFKPLRNIVEKDPNNNHEKNENAG